VLRVAAEILLKCTAATSGICPELAGRREKRAEDPFAAGLLGERLLPKEEGEEGEEGGEEKEDDEKDREKSLLGELSTENIKNL